MEISTAEISTAEINGSAGEMNGIAVTGPDDPANRRCHVVAIRLPHGTQVLFVGAGEVMVFRTSAFRPSIAAGAASLLTVALVISSASFLVLASVMSAARPSLAQTAPSGAQMRPADHAAEDEADAEDADAKDADAKEADAKDADIMKDIDVSKLDWSQLNVDASTLSDRSAATARSARPGAIGSDLNWSANDKPNGAAVSVKQAVSPFLDTRIGADMTVVRQQPKTMSELLSDKLTNGGAEPQSSGTAWAAITAPGAGPLWDKTAVEARVDPNQEQTRLGTSLSKTVPLTEQYSLSLQNGYNVTQPVAGNGARATRNYETDQSAKLSVFDTGTSVSVGQTMSSTDEKWLRKVGAEQKLFDGVNVSGSIGETGQGTISKSISAGFKRSW